MLIWSKPYPWRMACIFSIKMTSLTLFSKPTLWVSYLWTPLVALATWAHWTFIVHPLETLYMHGPRFLGCWEGKPVEDICVSLAPRSRAEFWLDHPEECMAMVDKNIYSWILVTQYLLGGLVIWAVAKAIHAWWWRRRLLSDLEGILHQVAALSNVNNKLLE